MIRYRAHPPVVVRLQGDRGCSRGGGRDTGVFRAQGLSRLQRQYGGHLGGRRPVQALAHNLGALPVPPAAPDKQAGGQGKERDEGDAAGGTDAGDGRRGESAAAAARGEWVLHCPHNVNNGRC